MVIHVLAILSGSLILALTALACYGYGAIGARMFRLPLSPIYCIWLGIFLVLLLLQALHLYFALTLLLSALIGVCGLCFAALAHVISKLSLMSKKTWLFIAGLFIFGAFALSRAMLPPESHDAGLYHLNAIRWVNDYAIIPGLGNLHGRLAFNQTFFLLAASMNHYPPARGGSLANVLIFLLTLATISKAITTDHPSLFSGNYSSRLAVPLCLLIWLLSLSCSTVGFNTPTPDFFSVLLQMIIFLGLVTFFSDQYCDDKVKQEQLCTVILLSALSITVKLSNIAFSSIAIAICFLYLIRSKGSQKRGAWQTFLLSFVFVMVWCWRGYITSGTPFYPATFGYIDFDWAIPKINIVEMSNLIQNWARTPGDSSIIADKSWNWLWPWLRRTRKQVPVIYPLTVSLFLTFLCIWPILRGRLEKAGWVLNHALILSPVIGGIIFWFLTAPDTRFVNGLFWLLAIGVTSLTLKVWEPLFTRKAFRVFTISILLVVNTYFILRVGRIGKVSFSGWHPVPSMPLQQKYTKSGLAVYVPVLDDRCGDSPLPCTPNFNPNLKLRIDNIQDHGFTVK